MRLFGSVFGPLGTFVWAPVELSLWWLVLTSVFWLVDAWGFNAKSFGMTVICLFAFSVLGGNLFVALG